MDDKEIKEIDVTNTSDEVDLSDDIKQTAFDGPLATKPDDLTDAVINEIARSETDEAMQAEDEKVIEAISTKLTIKDKISKWFHSWWDVPKKRNTFLAISALVFTTLLVLPTTRYAMLNAVGIRASANIVVLDESTSQPLKNVDVTVRGQTQQTDVDGRAYFESIKLGSTEITVKKIAYAESTNKQNIGFGENPLGETKLKPIGSQFSFEIIDWLSGKPIEKAEVSFYESSALSDKEGKASLTIEPTDDTEIEVTITADDYREYRYKFNTLSTENNKVSIKVGQADYFISNRSGKFDVYKKYFDEEASVLVAGTGNEREDMRFSLSSDRKSGMLVSTRDGNRNGDGFLLSNLYKINLETAELTKIDESERIDLIGWVDNKLVYVKIAKGASGKNPNRHRLQILDSASNENKEISASNYFNDVVVTDNTVFYAPSDAYKDNPDTALFKSDANGNVSKIYDAEVWTIIQTDEDELAFDATGDWYTYSVSDDSTSALSGPPSQRTSKIFVDGPKETTLWVDQRDGKGVLLDGDKVIWSQSGLKYPVQWLSDKHVVFRIVTTDETADYIINLDGGDAVKFTDVSNIPGTDRWYYY